MPKGAEKIDTIFGVSQVIGGLILTFALYSAITNPSGGLSFLTPNFINLCLLGGALFLHKNIRSFLSAVDDAIGGGAGILIQFPLYFGIMGVMKDSGLINMMAEFLASNSTATSFPIITFFSAGLINIFIPSGGGQWAVQGPIIIQTATELNIPLGKVIMAMAYGDQLTNMLQPFWALPLLGITGLKAKEILPYTLFIMLVGMVIFLSSLILF
jgi:short-chain fatty acids transporter